jgi:hypothetical protein
MIDFSISNKLTDEPLVSNNLLCVLQQIDLLFETEPGDVLGDNNFGTNYDKYLYTLGVGNSALENKILEDLGTLDMCGFKPSVTVTLLEGTVRDIALIDITLSGSYNEYSKTYVIK